jgi:hypothetical protein
MTADPTQLRFFVDETSLGLGKALAIARKDVVHTGHPLLPDIPLGALDTEWIPAVALRSLAVISRDRHIRTKPGEMRLLRASGLRVFWIAGKRDIGTWDALTRLVRRWEDVESILEARGPGPWFMAINERTVKEIPL